MLLDGIDALIALETFGTVSEAAVRLRLTQSAVSKRIQALQRSVGFRLIEPEGRRVRLTARAQELLERARPLVADLRALALPGARASRASFSLALADSIAASWGPAVVRRALSRVEGVDIALHAHRSVLIIESVRLGRYHVGLSTDTPAVRDLVHTPVVDEPMVLVRAAPVVRGRGERPLISIEPGSATWRAIEPLVRRHHPELLARPRVSVESFSAALQMVKAGFGDGLVPLGLAREGGILRSRWRVLPGLSRQVSLLTRKTVNQAPGFAQLRDELIAATRTYFERHA